MLHVRTARGKIPRADPLRLLSLGRPRHYRRRPTVKLPSLTLPPLGAKTIPPGSAALASTADPGGQEPFPLKCVCTFRNKCSSSSDPFQAHWTGGPEFWRLISFWANQGAKRKALHRNFINCVTPLTDDCASLSTGLFQFPRHYGTSHWNAIPLSPCCPCASFSTNRSVYLSCSDRPEDPPHGIFVLKDPGVPI